MMKTIFLATALVFSFGTATYAQYNDPVNPGSGPTAGGVILEGPQANRSLTPGLAFDEPATTGAVAPGLRRNGAGPTAGGVIDEESPFAAPDDDGE